jgi:hypothetical protein
MQNSTFKKILRTELLDKQPILDVDTLIQVDNTANNKRLHEEYYIPSIKYKKEDFPTNIKLLR